MLNRNERGGQEDSMSLAAELWGFMKERKKWWLLPIIIVMVLVGSLLIFAQGSALAPVIYTIF
jgi:hypothetical protein